MGNALCTSKAAFQEESTPVTAVRQNRLPEAQMEKQAPPAYSEWCGGLADVDYAGLSSIEKCLDEASKELRQLSLDIHDEPETAYKEFKTHDKLVNFMQSHGFKVSPHAYGLETAWQATFEHGSGGPVIGFNSEMDALPSIGHACGHNLIAICGVAGALAVAAALKENDVAGKVILLGTPAEEYGGGKLELLKAGAYKPMDVCLMLHPAPIAGLSPMLAIAQITAEYHGKGAHSAGAPWEGINALDAAVQVYNNISMMRQHIRPTDRMHGLIKLREDQPINVVPDYASVAYIIRSFTYEQLEDLKKRIMPIFKAAGESTGCEYNVEVKYEHKDVRHNGPLGQVWMDYMKEREKVEFPEEEGKMSIGSTDFGNVTYALPALHPIFRIDAPAGQGNHTPGFTNAARTMDAHNKAIGASKGLAASAWRFVTDEQFAKDVKEAYKKQQQQA